MSYAELEKEEWDNTPLLGKMQLYLAGPLVAMVMLALFMIMFAYRTLLDKW